MATEKGGFRLDLLLRDETRIINNSIDQIKADV